MSGMSAVTTALEVQQCCPDMRLLPAFHQLVSTFLGLAATFHRLVAPL
jgi:hypothetical protein